MGCENHGPNAAPGQGFVLSVYEDKVTGVGYDFIHGEPMDEAIPNARFGILLQKQKSS